MSTHDDQDLDLKDSPSKVVNKNEGTTKHSTMGPQTLALNTHKAGMEGLDAGKVNEIIKKASEGSKFYQHKQKCQERLDSKIADMMKAKASFSEAQISKATLQMDQLMNELEHDRDLTRTIVHVDMDMFYAAVEMRDDPSLRDKPMAVGSPGMLSTSNYAARKFGVRAAMPGFIGKKLCPELIIVPLNFTKYREASKAVQEVFAEYDPNFSPMSLDEAYLDITDFIKTNAHLYSEDVDEDLDNGNVAACIVTEMRGKIQAKTQLTASAGIAPNTRLAKICSDLNKPNGQFYLPPNRQKIMDFVASLPIRKVSGIGNVTEQQLSALGIKVCSDLLDKRGLLKLLFTDLHYNSLISTALGLGHTTLEAWTERDRKSISTETTFRGTSDKDFLFQKTEELCQELVDDMVQKDIFGKVFTLKIKTTDFQLKTKAHTLPDATRSLDVLVSTARRLLQHEMDSSAQSLSLRLIGVRMSSLVSSSELGPIRQITLTQMFSKAVQPKSQQVIKSSDENISSDSTKNIDSTLKLPVEHQNIKARNDVKTTNSIESFAVSHKNNLNTSNKEMVESSYSLFSKSPKKSKASKSMKYDCPVCYEQIEVKSLANFNSHVDVCLKSSTTKEKSVSPEVCSDIIVEEVTREIYHSDVELENDCQKEKYSVDTSDRFNTNNSSQIPSKMHDKESNKYKEASVGNSIGSDHIHLENCSTGARIRGQFLCPVCKKANFTDYNLLNRHLDECLNHGALEIIDEKVSLPGTSHNQPHQKASSKSFFGGLQFSGTSGKRNTSTHIVNQPRKKKKMSHNTLENYFSP